MHGVVVADRLLADRPQLLVLEAGVALTTARRSASIASWFWDVGGTIFASRIVPSASIRYAIEEAARRLADAVADPGHRLHGDERGLRLVVGLDQAQRLVAGVHQLHAARRCCGSVAARRLHPGSRAASSASGERGAVEGIPGERAAEVGAAVVRRVERVRALDVLLDEVLVVLGGADVEPAVGDDPAALDRIDAGLGERDELALDRTSGELEPGRPAHGREEASRARSSGSMSARSPRRGRPVEAADTTLIGWISRPPISASTSFPVFFSADRARPPPARRARARLRRRSRGSPVRGAC